MIDETKRVPAVRAIQDVIVKARLMAYERADYDQLVSILDGAEYLAAMFVDARNKTTEFRTYLELIAENHSWQVPIQRFDEEIP